MEGGTSEQEQRPDRGRRFWSKWTRALTPEQKIKALVAIGRIAALIGVIIQHCD